MHVSVYVYEYVYAYGICVCICICLPDTYTSINTCDTYIEMNK